MAIVANLSKIGTPTVSYARLYSSLECYAVRTADDVLYVVDHDSHVYALDASHAAALTLLGAVAGVERAHVLQALARAGEVV